MSGASFEARIDRNTALDPRRRLNSRTARANGMDSIPIATARTTIERPSDSTSCGSRRASMPCRTASTAPPAKSITATMKLQKYDSLPEPNG